MSDIRTINVGGTEYYVVDESTLKIVCDNLETSTTASKTYNKGDYFYLNNKLYRVTSTIAQGGTITPNSNCVQTSVDEELTSINSDLPKLLKEVSADGVKTRKQILQEFASTLSTLNERQLVDCAIETGGNIFHSRGASGTMFSFFGGGANTSGLDVTQLVVDTNSSSTRYVAVSINTGGNVTVNDVSSDVPTNGTKYRLFG